MAKFNERLRLLRQEARMSQHDLANRLGVSKSSINMYERGEREPGFETLEAIADYFNVDMDYLLGKSEHRSKAAWLGNLDSSFSFDALRSQIGATNIFPIEKRKFPLLGNIACGEPIFAEENFESYVEAGANIHAHFCLRASGNSMINARILDGDIVFIRKQDMVEDGEIAAVLIDNEATLKRVYYDSENGVLQLYAENPEFKVMRFMGADLDRIRILGKAVAFQSDVK